jgi:glycosyltransferase involved in cell wall biosynthesis
MMAMRIPLVSCNVYGLAEIVKHEDNALVPQENTPPQVANCIEELTRDKTLRQTLIENASVSVQQFDIPGLVAQINQIYRTIEETLTQ